MGEIIYPSAQAIDLAAVQYIEELALFSESLDCVDVGELLRFESCSKKVERGDLVLDMGDRIRATLA